MTTPECEIQNQKYKAKLEIKCTNQNISVTLIWAIVGNAKGFILRVIHWVYYF